MQRDIKPLVSIVIITWNNADCISKCIQSIEKYEKIKKEILIIDNDSQDNTVQIVSDLDVRYKDITLKRLNENVGYGAANDIGFKMANGKYIFILNPDVILVEPICIKLINVLESSKNIGLVAPRLLNKDYTLQKSVANFPVAPLYLFNQIHIGKLFPNTVRKKYFQNDYEGQDNRYVDWAIGAALMCRNSDLKQVGGFSSDYYMYGEDTRLCKDFAETLNLQTYYLYDSKLIHLGGQSEKQVIGKNKIYYCTWGVMHFAEVFYGEKERKKIYKEILLENRLKLLACYCRRKKYGDKIQTYKKFIILAKEINKNMIEKVK